MILSKPPLTIRFHLADGSVHFFVQPDDVASRKLWEGIDPAKVFARPRIVIGSEHSKSVFVSAEIVRVDFLRDHGSPNPCLQAKQAHCNVLTATTKTNKPKENSSYEYD